MPEAGLFWTTIFYILSSPLFGENIDTENLLYEIFSVAQIKKLQFVWFLAFGHYALEYHLVETESFHKHHLPSASDSSLPSCQTKNFVSTRFEFSLWRMASIWALLGSRCTHCSWFNAYPAHVSYCKIWSTMLVLCTCGLIAR